MDEVIAANTEAVTVTAGDDYCQLVIRLLYAGSHRERAAVQRVHTIRVDVAGEIRRASDAADGDNLVIRNLQLNQRLLQRGKHTEVAASRTPIRIDLAFHVGHGELFG